MFALPKNRPRNRSQLKYATVICEATHKHTFPPAYMFGLNRHLPPFVVVAVTDGALPG